MALTFAEYWHKRNSTVNEMAQSRDPAKVRFELDEKDHDFISQATAHAGITPQSALRARYTTLLQDKVQDGGKVRFFVPDKRKFIALPIARTHLGHLQDKLKEVGLDYAAENGFHPNDPEIKITDPKFYEKAFGRQNAADVLKNNAIDVNYGRSTGSKISFSARTAPGGSIKDADIESGKQNAGEIDDFGPVLTHVTKPVPKDWSGTYLKELFSDKSRSKDHIGFTRLDELPSSGKQKMYDFNDVWKNVQTLVGDVSKPGKHILPEVWSIFQRSLPQAGNAIFSGVRRKLLEFEPSALENPLELKQAMMQTTAMILSDPMRGNKRSSGGDFLQEVEELMSNDKNLASLSASMTSQGFVRKSLGANTNNTRNREYGGVKGTSSVQVDDMGKAHDLDKEIDDRDSLSRTVAPPEVKRRVAGESSPAAQRIKAQIQSIEPQALKIIAKLDAANWNMGAVSDEEWDLYNKYEKLQKEFEKAKNAPVQDFEDSGLPVAAQRQFRRNEAAGATGTLGSLDPDNPDFQVEGDPCSQVILGFNSWCKKRGKKLK